MAILDNVKSLVEKFFTTNGDFWVTRKSRSNLNIEKCNGVAKKDETKNVCDLCVALNETVFKVYNKPEYFHPNCTCKYIPTTLSNIILDFPMKKVENYLFFKEDKHKMMKTMGYRIQDSKDVYGLIFESVKTNFKNGNYKLGILDIHGQHFSINTILYGKRDHIGEVFNCHIGCVAWPNGKIKVATPLIKD